MQLALERCATAECGVKTMGALAEKHGFFPMGGEFSPGVEGDGSTTAIDDAGEAVTLADATGDAWVFHVVGGLKGVTNSVWAAQRVPKGHAAFIANNFIIQDLPVDRKPTKDMLFSEKTWEVAEHYGITHTNPETGALNFARTYAPDTVTFRTKGVPIPLYASLRLWRSFNLNAPAAKMPLYLDPLNYPFSVAVEKPMTRDDAFKLLGDLYEGTEFDLSKGALAGPFGNPFPVEGGVAGELGQIPRGISIARTVYGVINECKAEKVAGEGDNATLAPQSVTWVAQDTPATSVCVPVFPQTAEFADLIAAARIR